MDDDKITDLKHFITATSFQHYAELDGRITELRDEMRSGFSDARAEFANVRTEFVDVRSEMRKGFIDVRDEMNNGFTTIIDMIDNSNDANGDQLKNHERRLRRLEKKVR